MSRLIVTEYGESAFVGREHDDGRREVLFPLNDKDAAKRLAASWNTCAGIPTDDLESGKVVVLPVEEYRNLVGCVEELDEVEARMGNESEHRAILIREANKRLEAMGS